MQTVRVDPGAAASGAGSFSLFSLGASTSGHVRPVLGRMAIPTTIPASQRYFWSPVWQTGEQETDEELARGDAVDFPDATAAIRWLLDTSE